MTIMIPSNAKLLQCVQQAIGYLSDAVGNAEHKALLGAIDVALNELSLRCDSRFYLDYYHRGKDLAEEGARLLQIDAGDEISHKLEALPKTLNDDLGPDAIGVYTEQLTLCIEALTNLVGAPRDQTLKNYLRHLADWEVSLYRHRLEAADSPPKDTAPSGLTPERLQIYLRDRFPAWEALEVTAFEPLPGGFSKATTLFTTFDRINGTQELVMRAEQAAHILLLDGASVQMEFQTLQIAYGAGLPVPEPLWVEEDATLLGTCFLVSRKAKGRNYGTVVSASETLPEPLLESLVAEMARIHNVQLDPDSEWVRCSHLPDWIRFSTITENIRHNVECWNQLFETAPRTSSPLIRRGFNWLRANVPVCTDPPVFLHGDYGLHNILIDEEKVSAILDWEGARVGDPADELSWFLGATEKFMPREQLLALYLRAGGKPLTAQRMSFHDVLTCLKMAVICNVALSRLDENGANINMSVIGLRYNYPFASQLTSAIEKAEEIYNDAPA